MSETTVEDVVRQLGGPEAALKKMRIILDLENEGYLERIMTYDAQGKPATVDVEALRREVAKRLTEGDTKQ